MKFKEEIIEKMDTLNENIDVTKKSMQRRSMTPEQVYDALQKVQYNLHQIRALLIRE